MSTLAALAHGGVRCQAPGPGPRLTGPHPPPGHHQGDQAPLQPRPASSTETSQRSVGKNIFLAPSGAKGVTLCPSIW